MKFGVQLKEIQYQKHNQSRIEHTLFDKLHLEYADLTDMASLS
jgi:hypothetical protein